jgi:hypothetical protein
MDPGFQYALIVALILVLGAAAILTTGLARRPRATTARPGELSRRGHRRGPLHHRRLPELVRGHHLRRLCRSAKLVRPQLRR